MKKIRQIILKKFESLNVSTKAAKQINPNFGRQSRKIVMIPVENNVGRCYSGVAEVIVDHYRFQ